MRHKWCSRKLQAAFGPLDHGRLQLASSYVSLALLPATARSSPCTPAAPLSEACHRGAGPAQAQNRLQPRRRPPPSMLRPLQRPPTLPPPRRLPTRNRRRRPAQRAPPSPALHLLGGPPAAAARSRCSTRRPFKRRCWRLPSRVSPCGCMQGCRGDCGMCAGVTAGCLVPLAGCLRKHPWPAPSPRRPGARHARHAALLSPALRCAALLPAALSYHHSNQCPPCQATL